MREKIDLTGQRFGRLLVINKAEDQTYSNGKIKIMWHCKCDCGTEKDISENSLRYSPPLSCGCLQKEKVRHDKYDSLVGQKYNRLTVMYEIEPIIYQGKRRRRWHCKCECGNEKDYEQRLLVNGYIKSCGCLQREKSSEVGHQNKKYNTYDLSGDYGIGYCINGNEFYFDIDDYNIIKDYCWTTTKNPNRYVTSAIYDSFTQKTHHIRLSRLVMGLSDNDKRLVDHVNHNKKDNRKSNLRIVSYSQNLMNKDKPKKNTSGVTGVCWDKRRNKWRSYITINGKQISLGSYFIFEDAVKARKEGERVYFGEYSYDNSMEYAQTIKLDKEETKNGN